MKVTSKTETTSTVTIELTVEEAIKLSSLLFSVPTADAFFIELADEVYADDSISPGTLQTYGVDEDGNYSVTADHEELA